MEKYGRFNFDAPYNSMLKESIHMSFSDFITEAINYKDIVDDF